MAFFNKIRQALGFSDAEDDYDDIIARDDEPKNMYNHTTTATSKTHNATPAPHTEPEPSNPLPDNADTDKVGAIFEQVLAVFNDTLPDFLKKSVDPEAQRKYLYQSLDEGLKTYIAGLKDEAARDAETRWRKDNDALQSSVKSLEQRAREIEEKRTEISQKQLSSDRQRRALNERVHDLESTVARLEAEKEQFELERQSMVNKLKVAAVFEKENTELREQMNELRASRLKDNNNSNNNNEEDKKALEALNAELAEVRKQSETTIAELNERINAADAQASDKDAQLTAERKKVEQADQTIDALRKQTASLEEQTASLKKQAAKSDERIASLQKQIDDFDPINDPEIQKQIAQIQDKMSEYEEVKKRNEDTIASLRKKLKDEQRRNEQLSSKLSADKPEDKAPAANNKPKQPDAKFATPQNAPSIDDILGDTDWTLKTEQTAAKGHGRRSNDRNKVRPDNDPQMKLF